MNKGKGSKIAIKFTEELFGSIRDTSDPPSYKYYRWLITSTWPSSGRLYLYQLEFFSEGKKVASNQIKTMLGSSRYSTSYYVNKLFDGNIPGTEWDANGSLPHWVEIQLYEELSIDMFKWHTGTSGNKPKDFIFQGSLDGTNWINIYKDESPNINNWIDFNISDRGDTSAFSIKGKERKHVGGELIDGDYEIYKVELHPSMENTILITLNPIKRFNNVEGNLTVSYNSDLGDLTGMGGKVASFEVSFNPSDLIKKLNPYIREYLRVSNNAHVAFTKVKYRDRFTDDRITAKPNISLEFINVGEINP